MSPERQWIVLAINRRSRASMFSQALVCWVGVASLDACRSVTARSHDAARTARHAARTSPDLLPLPST